MAATTSTSGQVEMAATRSSVDQDPAMRISSARSTDAENVPILSPALAPHRATGLPTADVSGQGAFCRLRSVENTDLGYDFLVRLFSRATGGIIVTIRMRDVEQVFCTSRAGGAITFADLTDDGPRFRIVSIQQVRQLNPTVGRIIR